MGLTVASGKWRKKKGEVNVCSENNRWSEVVRARARLVSGARHKCLVLTLQAPKRFRVPGTRLMQRSRGTIPYNDSLPTPAGPLHVLLEVPSLLVPRFIPSFSIRRW